MSTPLTPTFEVGPRLPEDLLVRTQSLPIKPAPVELAGPHVRVVPLEPARDAPTLYAMSNGTPIRLGALNIGAYDAELLIWRYLRYGPFASVAECTVYLVELSSGPDIRPMTVIDQVSDRPIGVICMMANSPSNLKIELGHIWISPIMQGRGVIYEACYLLLRHCFELGYRRLEWKCDALNERSRRTALNLGYRYEGTQEQHMIVRGRNRDTAWYRLLGHEWPHARQELEKRLHI